MSYNLAGRVLVGGIVAWLKSYTNTPPLPECFVECNGQVLSDANSLLNGQTIPALNGASETTKKFLRGKTISGGADNTACHYHWCAGTGEGNIMALCCPSNRTNIVSHIPPYYEVVYCMRVK